MLRKRLITVLTINNGVLFRTRNFVPDYRYTINFVDAWSVDEVVLLDISRDRATDPSSFAAVLGEFAGRCFVPIAAGGGVRDMTSFRRMLELGADKVVLNAGAVLEPDLITQGARSFGSQCVVLSIDAKRNADGRYEVFIESGAKPTGLEPAAWARRAQELGAGEIMISSIDKDGSLEGYDNELNRLVSEAVDIPVLACGGAGKWQDFLDGFEQGKAQAVCTTNIYHFTETSIRSAKAFLKSAGVDVRT